MSHDNIKISKSLFGSVLFILVLIFIWSAATDLWAAPMATIRFKERVEIDADEVLVGQIATIEGGDAKFIQRLKNILIARAPLPGETRRIDLNFLQNRLKQHHIDPATVIVIAPPQIDVIRSHVAIRKAEIEKIVSEFIVRQAPQGNLTLRIKELQVPESVILPKGRITYRATAPRNRQLMGRCPIAVRFSVDGYVQKKVWTTAVIEVLGPVVVTRKPLGRYEPITANDIEVQTLDLADLPADVLSDPDAAIGKRTKRAVGAQVPLKADSIELPPLVKRGDFVTIIVESESLKITTLGQVKRKGRLGERIPVVNLDSKKVLQALVVDANTVKVDF